MRRLLSIIAAFVVVAGPLATAGGVVAKDHREERRDTRREAPQGARGGGERWSRRPDASNPPPRSEESGRWESPGEPRGEPRGDPRGDPRGYVPQGGYPPVPRRGGYMGLQGGSTIGDYGRYRLRPPPRGYNWVRVGGGFALVGPNGQVFDVVPY